MLLLNNPCSLHQKVLSEACAAPPILIPPGNFRVGMRTSYIQPCTRTIIQMFVNLLMLSGSIPTWARINPPQGIRCCERSSRMPRDEIRLIVWMLMWACLRGLHLGSTLLGDQLSPQLQQQIASYSYNCWDMQRSSWTCSIRNTLKKLRNMCCHWLPILMTFDFTYMYSIKEGVP